MAEGALAAEVVTVRAALAAAVLVAEGALAAEVVTVRAALAAAVLVAVGALAAEVVTVRAALVAAVLMVEEEASVEVRAEALVAEDTVPREAHREAGSVVAATAQVDSVAVDSEEVPDTALGDLAALVAEVADLAREVLAEDSGAEAVSAGRVPREQVAPG